MHGRFDITIRGRVVSPTSIVGITLLIDGAVAGATCFGQTDLMPATVKSDGRPMHERAFQYTLRRHANTQTERCSFQVKVRDAEGTGHVQDFGIEINPAKDGIAVVSGMTGSFPEAANPHAILHTERGVIDLDDVLLVQGWAVSLEPIIAMQIFAGEAAVADAGIGELRDDVAAAFPAYLNANRSGFQPAIAIGRAATRGDVHPHAAGLLVRLQP